MKWRRPAIRRPRKHSLRTATPRLEVLEERRLLSATPQSPLAEPLVLTGGAEFQVNTTTAGDQTYPRVTPFADGSFAVVWQHNGYPTMQRYDAAGDPVGTETTLKWTPGFASVAADGSSIVARDSGSNLIARRHDSDGNDFGATIYINTLPLNAASGVKVFTDAAGNHTFVWRGSTTDWDMVYYRRFDANGAPLTDQTPLEEAPSVSALKIAMNPSGELLVGYGSKATLIRADNTVIYAALPNPNNVDGMYVISVDITASGNFAVQYSTYPYTYVQRFDATGLPDGDPVDVTYTPAIGGSLLLEPGGDFVLVDDRSSSIYEPPGSARAVLAQRFDASGTAEPAFLVNTYVPGRQEYPSATMLDSATFVVAWQSQAQDGSGEGIFAKRFTDDDTPTVELVSPEAGPSFSDNSTLFSQVAGLRVTFSRPMDESSVESLANWQLLNNGNDLSGLIAEIRYENDIAYVTLTEPLRGTGYELILHDTIQDTLGRALDGDGDDTAGGDFSITFSVRQGIVAIGPEQIVNGDAGLANGQTGLAINDDGTYAASFNTVKGPYSNIFGPQARVFDAAGQAVYPSVTFDDYLGPMLPMQDGQFVVGLPRLSGTLSGATTFDANGTDTVTQFITTSFRYSSLYFFARASDGTYVATSSVQTTLGPPYKYDVLYQRFAADGTALGPALSVDPSSNDVDRGGQQILMLPNDEFIIVWGNSSQSGTGTSVQAGRFAADGTPLGEIIDVYSSNGYAGYMDVAADNKGNFTISWSDIDTPTSTEQRIFTRRFDSNGQALTDAMLWRTFTDSRLIRPSIAMDDSGRSMITWNEGSQVFVQVFAADGAPITDPFQINSQPANAGTYTFVAMNATGEVLVSWQHPQGGLRLRRFSLGEFPVLDLNGGAEGIDFAAETGPSDPPVTIVDPLGLTIDTASPTLVGTTIEMDPSLSGGTLAIDTSGTAISAQYYGPRTIRLSGVDSVANYQQVLRTLTYASPNDYAGGETVEVQLTIDDGAATSPIATARVRNTAPAFVSGRYLYYKGASYDQELDFGHYKDNGAYDTFKRGYQAGTGPATFQNVSSYSRGINGILIMGWGDYGVPTVDDFTFKIGTSADPSTWVDAPAPSAITFRDRQGINSRDLIEITWPDGAIKNTWLQVTMLANANTGLAADDVFYFGSRIGDTGLGNSAAAAITSATDDVATRINPGFGVWIDNPYDFNRDGLVSAVDQVIARNNTGFLPLLNLLPATPQAQAATPLAAASPTYLAPAADTAQHQAIAFALVAPDAAWNAPAANPPQAQPALPTEPMPAAKVSNYDRALEIAIAEAEAEPLVPGAGESGGNSDSLGDTLADFTLLER